MQVHSDSDRIARRLQELTWGSGNLAFAVAGGKDIVELINKAVDRLIETTRERTGRDYSRLRWKLRRYLYAWSDYIYGSDIDTVKRYVELRLRLLDAMVSGSLWIINVWGNKIIVTSGFIVYVVGEGYVDIARILRSG